MAVRASIKAIRSHLPERVLDNEELAREMPGWTPEKILEKTGIERRHIAAGGECASDLGVAAVRRLFDDALCRPEDVDFLVLCTQSPDHFLPSSSCLMQERLGLPKSCGTFDFTQGCSGFVYGLSIAKGLIETGQAGRVVVVTAETYSKHLNRRDRSVRTIFGDGAAATLVEGVESDQELIGPFVFGTDGGGGGQLIVPAGGMRRPRSEATAVAVEAESGNWRSQDDLYMNGPEIFTFTLRVVPAAVNALLRRADIAMGDVDLVVLHQANQFMLERLRQKMGIPGEKFVIALRDVGNTVSSTIPIALERAWAEGRLPASTRVMTVGFGVGLSWAGALLKTA